MNAHNYPRSNVCHIAWCIAAAFLALANTRGVQSQEKEKPGRVRILGPVEDRKSNRTPKPLPRNTQSNSSQNTQKSDSRATTNSPNPNGWKLERVELTDETEFLGVILSEGKKELEFAEIVRPKGRPMYIVIRPIPINSIVDIDVLPVPQHNELLARVQRFKNRLRVEAGKMDDVVLTQLRQGNRTIHVFNGPWFQLTSSTDELSTRRCVVRIEQVFRAYRQVMLPQIEPVEPLHVVLYGSMDEYQGYLQRHHISIKSPAFYSAAKNTIVAGSDINRFSDRFLQSQKYNEEVAAEYQKMNREFKTRLAKLFERMRANGIPSKEIENERVLRQASWNREFNAKMQEIKTTDRRNSAKFNEVTHEMFKRIFHEAFHAYLNNYIFEDADRRVPRWLNEGLAQVFEDGQLDDGMLRIDAPNPQKLKAVQNLFNSQTAFPIADLLRAPNNDFLVTHADASSQQHYLQSWGLTYYLVFNKNLLGNKLHEYVRRSNENPFAPFQDLVGQSLNETETQYSQYLKSLK